jgi:UDP-GlcNAc:undecaprenyl-phosphate GlcNAc-1-phosphate transferase
MCAQLWMIVPFAVAFLCAAGLTPLVIALARRLGVVAMPRPDRWHQRPTALMGGTALYGAGVLAALVTLPEFVSSDPSMQPRVIGLLGAVTIAFALGFLDDLRGMGPSAKVAGQTLGVCVLVMSGIRMHAGGYEWLAVPATFLWVVGITNAVNLLDNMDGVVAGVVGIASIGMAIHGAMTGQVVVMILALALAGACGGFLLYNFNPARIFMGDCGSLFLGFSISALALMATSGPVVHLLPALIVPGVLLAIPIFDTTLVSIARWLHGRPLSQGGRDHTTHRLVALGVPEKLVALLLYATTALLCALSLAVAGSPPIAAITLAALILLAMGLVGAFLGAVPVYQSPGGTPTGGFNPGERHARGEAVMSLLPWLRVMLDVALVPLALAIALLLRFDGAVPPAIFHRATILLPVWIAVKSVGLVVCGAHAGMWRSAGVRDVIATLKGSSLGSLVALALVIAGGGMEGLSRSVLILDWLVFTSLALLVRVAFVLLHHSFANRAAFGEPGVGVPTGPATPGSADRHDPGVGGPTRPTIGEMG